MVGSYVKILIRLSFGCRMVFYYVVQKRCEDVPGSLQIDVIFKRCKNEKVTLSQRLDNVIWLIRVQQKTL